MTSLLEVHNVSRAFGGLLAVSSVSLAIVRGEILGLIGPNGAGKTTLFNLISGFYRPSSGEIRLDGQIISGLRPDAICARGLARTFQLVKPFPKMTVLENVMVGAFKHTNQRQPAMERAGQWVDFVGLGDQARQPAGALTLSDRKRLELARALATQPRLLLLDEVMSGLTPAESMTFVDLVRQIRERDITVLVIEHVMPAIMALSDRIAALHHGQLIAIGAPQEVVRNPAVVEAYLGEELLLVDD
jgi:branched-chain amino acid transport system ATP-binding protein